MHRLVVAALEVGQLARGRVDVDLVALGVTSRVVDLLGHGLQPRPRVRPAPSLAGPESNVWSDLSRPPLRPSAGARVLAGSGLWRELTVVADTGSTNARPGRRGPGPRTWPRASSSRPTTSPPAGAGSTGTGPRPPRSGLAVSVLLDPARGRRRPLVLAAAAHRPGGRRRPAAGRRAAGPAEVAQRRAGRAGARSAASWPSWSTTPSGPARGRGHGPQRQPGRGRAARADRDVAAARRRRHDRPGGPAPGLPAGARAPLRPVARGAGRPAGAAAPARRTARPASRSARDVRVELPSGEAVSGVADGVDDEGRLLVTRRERDDAGPRRGGRRTCADRSR